MSATTEKARELLSSRLTEIDTEKRQVERAMEALGTNGAGPRRGRPRKGRPRGPGGYRSRQALEMIVAQPGITASEIAAKMEIKPNYLYRVLSDLEKAKKVKKKGRTYTAA
jgi:predicted HTH transcriptional regulator